MERVWLLRGLGGMELRWWDSVFEYQLVGCWVIKDSGVFSYPCCSSPELI